MSSQESKRLFAPGKRKDSRYHLNAESMFEFYDRVGPSPLWDEIRTLLDEWLGRHPDAEKLRPNLVRDFQPFFWELYVHEIFRRLSYHCVVERLGTSDAPNRPDYFCTKGDAKLVVECWDSESGGFDRQLNVVDVVEEGELKRKLEYVDYDEGPSRWLGEMLNNRIVSPNLAVALDDLDATWKRPAWKKICGPVQTWIDSATQIGEEMRFTADDWSFTLATLPRSNDDVPFVAVYPGVAPDLGRPAEALLKGLLGKAKKKYLQSEDELLLIAANFPSTFLSPAEVEAKLYGTGGLWSNGHNRHVRGVLLGKFIQPLTVATSFPTLWLNPDAPEVDLPFETVRPESSGLVWVESSVAARKFFSLLDGWGTAKPFPDVS